ncbi:hypothetical protein FYJ91_03755 [Sphingomonas montanisoli]|uniref:Uncharacterized protein n=1 Tax=Sphingomonas montanisoli TaxID=2606412 RepID=A0A5D9CC04_9SPHN|nr:hypothetical protein FYJ91_03755 [Sphingomonas montanisoli]
MTSVLIFCSSRALSVLTGARRRSPDAFHVISIAGVHSFNAGFIFHGRLGAASIRSSAWRLLRRGSHKRALNKPAKRLYLASPQTWKALPMSDDTIIQTPDGPMTWAEWKKKNPVQVPSRRTKGKDLPNKIKRRTND